MMRNRKWIFGTCFAALLLLGMSAAPRYLEELRIGGGYGEAGGGLDIDANGNLFTDGSVTARGRLTAGTAGHVLTNEEGLLDGARLQEDSVADAKVSDELTVGGSGHVHGAALDIPTVQNESVADNADSLLIHDASVGATREMSRQDFLSGAGGGGLWVDAGAYINPSNAPGIHLEDDGDVVLPESLTVQGGCVSIGAATGNTYLLKAQFQDSASLAMTDRSALDGQIIWSGGPHSASNIHGVVGRSTVGAGYSATNTDVVGVRGLVISGPAFTQINRGIGVKGQIVLTQSGSVAEAMALYGGAVRATGTATSLYGLYLEDVTQGTSANYAIYTGLGHSRFGDDVTIAGDLEAQGATLLHGGLSVAGRVRLSSVVTFTADDTTPGVDGANAFRVPDTWTAANDVTNLDNGLSGQTVTIIGGDPDCVFIDNTNLRLAGNWTAHPADTLVLLNVDGAWHEISRSDN